jgi:alpha-tubulin suppressor-like RCC1 family protein
LLQGALNGVAQLAAGGDASAVVDLDGKLWMWGKLADTTEYGTLPKAQSARGGKPLPCFDTFEKNPRRISSVGRVQNVAVGSNHVLASVTED